MKIVKEVNKGEIFKRKHGSPWKDYQFSIAIMEIETMKIINSVEINLETDLLWNWSETVKSLSYFQLLATPWIVACQAPLFMDSPGKNAGVGCHWTTLIQPRIL